MKKLANDILGRLCVGHLDSADIDHEALARLIRDADKGVTSLSYELTRVRDVLIRLGGIHANGLSICEWARLADYRKLKKQQAPSLEPVSSRFARNPLLQAIQRRLCCVSSHIISDVDDSPYGDTSSTHIPDETIANEAVADYMPDTTAPPIRLVFSFWIDVLAAFDHFAEGELQFGMMFKKHLVVVTSAVRIGSPIESIEHFILPVVLDHKRNSDGSTRLFKRGIYSIG